MAEFVQPRTARPRRSRRWTAAELLRLPPEKRDAILARAAALAAPEYRRNRELTAFEAYGKSDLATPSKSGIFRGCECRGRENEHAAKAT